MGAALCIATALLISPPANASYPGAIPWSAGSLLRRIVNLLSFGSTLQSIRGVEIKEAVFHAAAAGALLLVAIRALLAGFGRLTRAALNDAWLYAQLLLLAWVGLSAASAAWSGDAGLSLSQAGLYAISAALAIGLAWTIEARHLRVVLGAVIVAAELAAVLCIWYFYERNPNHRPGFPIGNPGVLGAFLVPAILLLVTYIVGSLADHVSEIRPLRWGRLVTASCGLIPLAWCLWLTGSRSATVALGVGLVLVAAILSRRRARWVVLGVGIAVVAAALAWIYVGRYDLGMARGATLRFREYAWRYAAALWWNRPISGHGAASYPRLATALSTADRTMDPGAFMGDVLEHSHNELFEVFTEIGLIGGVTYVGAWIGTLAAGLALLRAKASDRQRWVILGMVTSVAALLADAMFSRSLRLPGPPALLSVLTGCLWAACRWETARWVIPRATPSRVAPWLRAAVCGLAACGAAATAWAGVRNWSAVQAELHAEQCVRSGRAAEALDAARQAERGLLDPVRRLLARERIVRILLETARVDSFAASAAAAYEAAMEVERRSPNLGRVQVMAARAAELAAERLAASDPASARDWLERAERAWRRFRVSNPFDVETLLALARYPAQPLEYVALLRDALRAGFPPPEWYDILRHYGGQPNFDSQLAEMYRAVGPMHPSTELNLLVLSMAPEVYRLGAAWQALQGAYADAARDAQRAAELYRPMQARFPTLRSVALAEQADYLLRNDSSQAARSAELIRTAITELPPIQPQQFAALAAPFRLQLTRHLIAAGDLDGARSAASEIAEPANVDALLADCAVQLVETFARSDAAPGARLVEWCHVALKLSPAHLRAWSWRAWLAGRTGDWPEVRAILQQAARAGVNPADIERIRQSLCAEFPAARESLRRGG